MQNQSPMMGEGGRLDERGKGCGLNGRVTRSENEEKARAIHFIPWNYRIQRSQSREVTLGRWQMRWEPMFDADLGNWTEPIQRPRYEPFWETSFPIHPTHIFQTIYLSIRLQFKEPSHTSRYTNFLAPLPNPRQSFQPYRRRIDQSTSRHCRSLQSTDTTQLSESDKAEAVVGIEYGRQSCERHSTDEQSHRDPSGWSVNVRAGLCSRN